MAIQVIASGTADPRNNFITDLLLPNFAYVIEFGNGGSGQVRKYADIQIYIVHPDFPTQLLNYDHVAAWYGLTFITTFTGQPNGVLQVLFKVRDIPYRLCRLF